MLPYFSNRSHLHVNTMLRGALLTLLAPLAFAVLVLAMGVIAALALVPIAVAVTRMLWLVGMKMDAKR